MTKGVLGNDPFQRGAAPRSNTPPAETPAVVSAPEKSRAETPVRRARTVKPGKSANPPRIAAKKATPRPPNPDDLPSLASAEFQPHPDSPEVLRVDAPNGDRAEEEAVAHASSPTLVEVRPTVAEPSATEMPRAEVEAPRSAPIFAPESSRPSASTAIARLADLALSPGAGLFSLASWRQKVGTAVEMAKTVVQQAVESEVTQTTKQVLGGSYKAMMTGLGSGDRGATIDDFGKDVELSADLVPLADVLVNHYWRVTVEGAENVPNGRCILVANHAGALPLDGPVLHHALSRHRPDLRASRWLVEDQVFRAPFIGLLLNRLGAVRSSTENAIRLLEEDRPVLVFPEGVQGLGKGLAERYQLRRFGRGGFVKVARKVQAPIVPVAIVGAEETSPVLAKVPAKLFGLPYLPVTSPVPLPAKWTIRFGKPIQPGKGLEDVAGIQAVADETRDGITRMLQELLGARTSVFGG